MLPSILKTASDYYILAMQPQPFLQKDPLGHFKHNFFFI